MTIFFNKIIEGKINLFKILEISKQQLWDLQEVKNYLRISHSYDDVLLSNLIETAISSAENFTGLSLSQKQILFSCNLKNTKSFQIRFKPLQRIVMIGFVSSHNYVSESFLIERDSDSKEVSIKKDLPEDFDTLTLESYYYDEQKHQLFLRDYLPDNKVLQVKYIAGLEPEQVPKVIKHGILLHVASMYDRDEITTPLSSEVRGLYMPYRLIKL